MRQRSRRAVLGTCGAALAVGAGCLERLGSSDGEESNGNGSESASGTWPSFRGGPSNTGFVETDGPRSDPTRRWTVDVGRPRTAAIADGTVYLTGGSTLHAIGLVDGDERWTVDLGSEATGAPAVADDAVVCPVAGALVVVDGGDERDRISLEGGTASVEPTARRRYQSQTRVRSSPTVVDGTAYVGTAAGDLVAVDLEGGDVAWRSAATSGWTALSQKRSTGGVTSPAVVDGRVFVGTDAGVAAFDAVDGSSEWTHGTDRAVSSSPAVVDGTVYVGGSPPMALAADDGDEVWRADAAVEALGGGRTEGPVDALRRQELAPMAPSIAVADETVVVHDAGDRLLALDRADGRQLWETPLERIESLSTTQLASSWSSPVIAGDVVVVGTSDGIVAASLTDGDGLWRLSTDSRVLASPAVAGGTIVVGEEGGTVHALAPSD